MSKHFSIGADCSNELNSVLNFSRAKCGWMCIRETYKPPLKDMLISCKVSCP
jgi:hypothetical protein